MAIITKIEIQKKNKERVNIYLDEEYAFSISAYFIDFIHIQRIKSIHIL